MRRVHRRAFLPGQTPVPRASTNWLARVVFVMGLGVAWLGPPHDARAADPVPPPVPDSAPASASAPAGLRLEDAVQLALTRNERAQISDLNQIIADAAVDKARATFLPVLTASASDSLRRNESPTNLVNGAITLNAPLLNPSAFPLYSQAKELLESQRFQTIDDKRTLQFDTVKAFISVLFADDVVKAAQRQLDTSRANLADTQARVKAGLNSSNDVTRAQTDLAGATRELANDKGNFAAAVLNLAFTVNAPVQNIAPPTDLLDVGVKPIEDPTGLVALALARRPDLAVRRYAAEAAHDFADEPYYRMLPTLGLNAQLSATSAGSGNTADVVATLTATWVLFDNGTRYADLKSRGATAEIAELDTTTLERTVEVEVRTAIAQLSSAQAALAAAADAVTAARQNTKESAILYRQGLAKAIELVDANEEQFTAEVDYATAQFSVVSAYLALRQAVGLDALGTELK